MNFTSPKSSNRIPTPYCFGLTDLDYSFVDRIQVFTSKFSLIVQFRADEDEIKTDRYLYINEKSLPTAIYYIYQDIQNIPLINEVIHHWSRQHRTEKYYFSPECVVVKTTNETLFYFWMLPWRCLLDLQLQHSVFSVLYYLRGFITLIYECYINFSKLRRLKNCRNLGTIISNFPCHVSLGLPKLNKKKCGIDCIDCRWSKFDFFFLLIQWMMD